MNELEKDGDCLGNYVGDVLEKVLIVEDEVHARTGLTELIESWGYRAECAADGVEGLEKVVAWAPAIVVTDLKMPRMDGMELLSRIGEAAAADGGGDADGAGVDRVGCGGDAEGGVRLYSEAGRSDAAEDDSAEREPAARGGC